MVESKKETLQKQAKIEHVQASIKRFLVFSSVYKLYPRNILLYWFLKASCMGFMWIACFYTLTHEHNSVWQRRSSPNIDLTKQGQGMNVLDLILAFGIFHKVTALRS